MDKVVHFEIPTDDINRTDKFYSKIFRWQIHKTPFSEVYHLANTVETEKMVCQKVRAQLMAP